MMLQTSSMQEDDEEFIPPFYLNLHVVTQYGQVNTTTLLDSKADYNVISHELWLALK